MSSPKFYVRSGALNPVNAYVAIPCRDRLSFMADEDIGSKA